MKQELFTDEFLGRNRDCQCVFMGLHNFADDSGYFPLNLPLIRGTMFPYDENMEAISSCIARLQAAGFLELRITDGIRVIGLILDWASWQKVDHPGASKLEDAFQKGAPFIQLDPLAKPREVVKAPREEVENNSSSLANQTETPREPLAKPREDFASPPEPVVSHSESVASPRESFPDFSPGIGEDRRGEERKRASAPPPPRPGGGGKKASALHPMEAEFVKLWNETAAKVGFEKCLKMSATRSRLFAERMKDPEWWIMLPKALAAWGKEAWCTGGGDRKWRGTVDWMLREETVLKGAEKAAKAPGAAGNLNVSLSEEEFAAIEADEARRQEEELAGLFEEKP